MLGKKSATEYCSSSHYHDRKFSWLGTLTDIMDFHISANISCLIISITGIILIGPLQATVDAFNEISICNRAVKVSCYKSFVLYGIIF